MAPKFVRPTVTGSPLLVDWFEDVDALDKKWIRSRGKKDDVEDSIAKYNGVSISIIFNTTVRLH